MWEISTKPNSPPAHSQRPLRMAVPGSEPKARDSPAMRTNLPASSSTSRPATQGHWRTITPTSRNMPTVMKNSPSRTSRKGLMSSST